MFVDQQRQEQFSDFRRADDAGLADQKFAVLDKRYSTLEGRDLLEPLIQDVFPGQIAVASSFGAESAVLLHMIASIDPSVPVLFGDTEKLFPETLAYHHQLTNLLGLTDVRRVKPELAAIQKEDSEGTLWRADPDRCCHLRKVLPFQVSLEGFSAWITGRKRFQGGARSSLPVIEEDGERIKVNPLAHWSLEQIEHYMKVHDLPDHPLKRYGYLSLGCTTCTRPVEKGENQRAGRWAGLDKIECGIHFINGRPLPSGPADGGES